MDRTLCKCCGQAPLPTPPHTSLLLEDQPSRTGQRVHGGPQHIQQVLLTLGSDRQTEIRLRLRDEPPLSHHPSPHRRQTRDPVEPSARRPCRAPARLPTLHRCRVLRWCSRGVWDVNSTPCSLGPLKTPGRPCDRADVCPDLWTAGAELPWKEGPGFTAERRGSKYRPLQRGTKGTIKIVAGPGLPSPEFALSQAERVKLGLWNSPELSGTLRAVSKTWEDAMA